MKYNSNSKFDENNIKYQINSLLWPDGQHSAIMINENELFILTILRRKSKKQKKSN